LLTLRRTQPNITQRFCFKGLLINATPHTLYMGLRWSPRDS
jgi:hypothetical protein